MIAHLAHPLEMSLSDSSDAFTNPPLIHSGDQAAETQARKRIRSDSVSVDEKKVTRSEVLMVELQNMRRANSFLDVCLKSGSSAESIRAHACFLAAMSPKLNKMLQQAERNAEHDYVLELSDVPFSAVRKVINFLYTNDLPVRNDRETREVTETAKFLEITIPPLVLSESNRLECSNTLIGHLGYICALAMTKDGSLVSGSRDNSIRIWDPKSSSRPQIELSGVHSNRVWALITVDDPHSGEEKLISGSWDSTLIVWNPKTWKIEKRLAGHDDWVTCMAVVGKKHFVSGSSDSTLRVWNTSNFEPERVLRGHRGHVYAVCTSRESQYLFSAGDDGFIYVWETKHWRVTQKLKGHPDFVVRAVCWCSQFNGLVSGASDGRLRLWNFERDKFVMKSDIEAHTDWVEAMCDMSKGRFASGSRDCTVKIWNSQGSWECLQTIRQHTHWVYALLFERDMLISASCDMKIKIWEEEKELLENE